MNKESSFLSGVIEGFYGPPWTHAERQELFDWMVEGGLNTYLYGPKDDLKHRAIWRESYTAAEAGEIGRLIYSCQQQGLNFVYALGPGLDLRYTRLSDIEKLQQRFEQMMQLGCRNFCLLFDDIPDRMDAADLDHWGSLAAAQCGVSNALYRWIRERQSRGRFLFCPTPYCGRMAARQLGGEGYLETVGRELLPEIDIFWTGPEIISREISLEHIADVASVLRRKPVIWDNLHANDYDGRRFFCGPYSGRPAGLHEAVGGILLNPNVEFPLNFVPLRTLAEYLRGGGDWTPRVAYESAMRVWQSRFETVSHPLGSDELLLFGDSYYLPYAEGVEAERLYADVRGLLTTDPSTWGAAAAAVGDRLVRLREFCARLTELRDRPLFHALSRRAWELREELDLLDKYITFKSVPENYSLPFRSDVHLPKTYRGGMVSRLQQLLIPQPDESLVPLGNQ